MRVAVHQGVGESSPIRAHICRLQEPNRDALVLYARFIGDAVGDVLSQLIETMLVKDRDFVAWHQEHPTRP